MIDTNLRKHVQTSFDSFAKTVQLHKVHPNVITTASLIVGLGSFASLSMGRPLPALVLLWVSGSLDVLDGTVARLSEKSSKLGAFLDLVFDRVVESALIFGFYFFMPQFSIFYFLFYIGMIFNFSTFMVAGALFPNDGRKSMHYDVGLVERTESFITFSLMMLFPRLIPLFLGIFNILMIITGIIRIKKIIAHERNQ